MGGSDEKNDERESLTPSERRLGYRHLACFPAYLERDDGGTRASMIHDLSVSGALLLVRADMKVGDMVRLKLFIHGDINEARDVTGAIVRVEKLSDPHAGPWSRRIAVHFHEELTDLEPEIAHLASRQAEFFAPKPSQTSKK
jgi:hypothetical protein